MACAALARHYASAPTRALGNASRYVSFEQRLSQVSRRAMAGFVTGQHGTPAHASCFPGEPRVQIGAVGLHWGNRLFSLSVSGACRIGRRGGAERHASEKTLLSPGAPVISANSPPAQNPAINPSASRASAKAEWLRRTLIRDLPASSAPPAEARSPKRRRGGGCAITATPASPICTSTRTATGRRRPPTTGGVLRSRSTTAGPLRNRNNLRPPGSIVYRLGAWRRRIAEAAAGDDRLAPAHRGDARPLIGLCQRVGGVGIDDAAQRRLAIGDEP